MQPEEEKGWRKKGESRNPAGSDSSGPFCRSNVEHATHMFRKPLIRCGSNFGVKTDLYFLFYSISEIILFR